MDCVLRIYSNSWLYSDDFLLCLQHNHITYSTNNLIYDTVPFSWRTIMAQTRVVPIFVHIYVDLIELYRLCLSVEISPSVLSP